VTDNCWRCVVRARRRRHQVLVEVEVEVEVVTQVMTVAVETVMMMVTVVWHGGSSCSLSLPSFYSSYWSSYSSSSSTSGQYHYTTLPFVTNVHVPKSHIATVQMFILSLCTLDLIYVLFSISYTWMTLNSRLRSHHKHYCINGDRLSRGVSRVASSGRCPPPPKKNRCGPLWPPKMYVKNFKWLFLHRLLIMCPENVTSEGYKHKKFLLAPCWCQKLWNDFSQSYDISTYGISWKALEFMEFRWRWHLLCRDVERWQLTAVSVSNHGWWWSLSDGCC